MNVQEEVQANQPKDKFEVWCFAVAIVASAAGFCAEIELLCSSTKWSCYWELFVSSSSR